MDARELFLAAVDGLNRADMGAITEVVHPEVVFHPIRAEMSGDYFGHRGIEKFLADNAETFAVFEVSYDDIRPLDDDRLFAAGKVRVRGRGGHVDTVVDSAGYASFRDGLLSGWHDYGDRAAALEALGLADERPR